MSTPPLWLAPVYDRTQADVDARAPKAFCNVADLNRLENNCAALAALLGATISPRHAAWQRTDFPTQAQQQRLAQNLATLRSAYIVYQSTPAPPAAPLTTWQKWNAAERILHDSHTIFLQAQGQLRHAGEFWCGT